MNKKLTVFKPSSTLTLLLCCGLSLPSYAELVFNGFGSVRATNVSSEGESPYPTLPEEGRTSFKEESLFAIQARADLGEDFSVTIQLMAEGIKDFNVEAQWAYLSYQVADNHIINAGKLANPIFHQSEYEKVGYAHNFARLPYSVYSRWAFSTVEGISLDSNFEVTDDIMLTTKLLYGNWDGTTFIPSTQSEEAFALPDIFSVNLTLAGEWWKVFAGGYISDMDAARLDQIFIGGASGVANTIADDDNFYTNTSANDKAIFEESVQWSDKDVIYVFAGFGIDYEGWLLDAEYADVGIRDSVDSINESYFVSIGKRIDNVVITLHTEEATQKQNPEYFERIDNSTLRAAAQTFNGILGRTEYEGTGITVRYDFHPSATFKVDYFKGEHSSAAVDDYSIFSAGVDFVF